MVNKILSLTIYVCKQYIFRVCVVTGNGRNVALHKETSMSSTRRVQYSRRAVDGVTDGNDESMTIHTKEDKPNAWWKVDLEMEVHSPLVRLFFRYDCK